jgi:hypothetical protein
MSDTASYACPRCQIGHLHQAKATFIAMYLGVLLSIPDLDAWMCDICQYREFDYTALSQVELLTGPLTSDADMIRPMPRASSIDLPDLSKSQRLKP